MPSSLIEKIKNCDKEAIAIIYVNKNKISEMHFEPWDISYDDINRIISINYEKTDVEIDLSDAVITMEEDETSELFGSYSIVIGSMEIFIDF